MEPIIVDAKGLSCPKPVVMSKKALAQLAKGQKLVVLVDNDVSLVNVENFLRAQEGEVSSQKLDEGDFRIEAQFPTSQPSQSTTESSTGKNIVQDEYVIAVKSNTMGYGSDELGAILIRAFINTIPEIEQLPSSVLFYNSGIELVLKDSTVLETLLELEEKGISIIVCGTCVQHYNQKDNVGIGTISNMYDIMEILAQTKKVIYP